MKHTKDKLEPIVKQSYSINDVLRFLGLKLTGGSHAYISKKIKHFEIDTSHFKIKERQTPHNKLVWQEILVEGKKDTREPAYLLRRSLLESGRIYECCQCKLSKWNNEILILQVHHLNRDFTDNRPINLEFICPNCHSQLPGTNGRVKKIEKKHITQSSSPSSKKQYKKKVKCTLCDNNCYKRSSMCRDCYDNKKTSNIPNKSNLIEALKNNKNFKKTGEYFNVSDNAIRKWCRRYNIPTHTKKMQEYIETL